MAAAAKGIEIATAAGQSFEQIHRSIDDVSAQIQEVSAAVEEITSSSDDVLQLAQKMKAGQEHGTKMIVNLRDASVNEAENLKHIKEAIEVLTS
jgi:methyl-accepting chemotaxis protein